MDVFPSLIYADPEGLIARVNLLFSLLFQTKSITSSPGGGGVEFKKVLCGESPPDTIFDRKGNFFHIPFTQNGTTFTHHTVETLHLFSVGLFKVF